MMHLVDASIRVSVVLAIALVTSAAMRRRAAAARHGLLAAALLLSALVAPLSWALPAVHLDLSRWVLPARPGTASGVVETSLTSFRAAASDGSSTIAAAPGAETVAKSTATRSRPAK